MAVLVRAVVLITAEAVVASAAWWLNQTRRDEGPVLLALTHGHGVHRIDLLVIAASLIVAILVLGWPTRSRSAKPKEQRPPHNDYPPIGTPPSPPPGS